MSAVLVEMSSYTVVETIKRFLKALLEKGPVDALLVPFELPSANIAVQTLVTGVDKLDAANPLAPVLPVNSARIVSAITKVGASSKKIGVVLRSCELRAVVELIKLKQISRRNLLIIGIDCFGTYSINDYSMLVEEGQSPTRRLLDLAKEAKDDNLLREACQVCEYPYPMEADIVIGLIGMDLSEDILIEASSEDGKKVLETLEFAGSGDAEIRKAAIDELVSGRTRKRDELSSV